jgi:UDP-2,3-diacylglucosamine pyrophosphatase LpxH
MTKKKAAPPSKKTVYLSDFHMTDEASFSAKPYPYGKMTATQAQRVASFLAWVGQRPKEFERVVLLGDIVDLWTVPHCCTPPTVESIIQAKQNAPIMKVLPLLMEAGIKVVYTQGNHDNGTAMEDFGRYVKGIELDNQYCPVESPICAEHGHHRCLFNGTDPRMRPSLGEFIARASATSTMKTGKGFPSEAAMLIKNREELVEIPKIGLVTCVWDAVVKEAKLKPTDVFVDPKFPNPWSVDGVGKAYYNLYYEFGEGVDSVLCEFDPYYGAFEEGETIYIAGHSHNHVFGTYFNGTLVYINTGAWCCDNECYFAVTWKEGGATWASLQKWTSSGPKPVNSASVQP